MSRNSATGRGVQKTPSCKVASEFFMPALILWLLGVPLSVIILLYLIF